MGFRGGVDSALRHLVAELERAGGHVDVGCRVADIAVSTEVGEQPVVVRCEHDSTTDEHVADRVLLTSGVGICEITVDGHPAVRSRTRQDNHHALVEVDELRQAVGYVHFVGRQLIRRAELVGMSDAGRLLLIVQLRRPATDHEITGALAHQGLCAHGTAVRVLERTNYRSVQTDFNDHAARASAAGRLITVRSQGDLVHHLRKLTPTRSRLQRPRARLTPHMTTHTSLWVLASSLIAAKFPPGSPTRSPLDDNRSTQPRRRVRPFDERSNGRRTATDTPETA